MNRVSFGEYSILCIIRIWVDWPGMGLPISLSSCFGPNEPGLCLGCCGGAWVWHGAHCSFGLVSGILDQFFYPPSTPKLLLWACTIIHVLGLKSNPSLDHAKFFCLNLQKLRHQNHFSITFMEGCFYI